MAVPASRTPEEDQLLERAMRVMPGGATGRPIADYRATLDVDRERQATFTQELIRRSVVTATRKSYVSLAHGEVDIEGMLAAFAAALAAAARARP